MEVVEEENDNEMKIEKTQIIKKDASIKIKLQNEKESLK